MHMLMRRWDPFAELTRLHDQLMGTNGVERGVFAPPVDIVETKDSYELRAELPGFAPDEINIEVDKGVLSITGEREFKEEKEDENYRRVERSYGRFSRSFSLPESVDAEAISADVEHGVLTVKLPKRPAATPRRVAIAAKSESHTEKGKESAA